MVRWLNTLRVAAAVTPGEDRSFSSMLVDVASVIGAKPVLIAAAAGLVVSILLVVVVSAAVVVGAATAMPVGSLGTIEDIPPIVAAAYTDAAAAGGDDLGCVIDVAVVAAIGWTESRHGNGRLNATGDAVPPIIGIPLDGNGAALIRDSDNGVLDGDTVYDRAVGPTQFLPATWQSWGQDGNADTTRNPQNIFDAAKATVWYLCGGAAADLTNPAALATAILRYNHSETYLAAVLAKTHQYRLQMTAGGGDATGLLAHPGFSASAAARADLETGLVDRRLVAILAALASQQPIHVAVIKTGHYQCVGGGTVAQRPACTESHHWHWRGADVTLVAGNAVTDTNTAAYQLVAGLAALPVGHPIRPSGVGSPWPGFDPLRGFFNDPDHQDHLHLSVCGPRQAGGRLVDSCG